MSSISVRPNGHRWIFYGFNGKRHTLRLGALTERDAREVQSRIDRLISQRDAGAHPDSDLIDWLQKIGGRLHKSLVTSGLATDRGPETLEELLARHEQHLVHRKVKPSTLTNSRVLYANLRKHFTPKRSIRSITEEHAQLFQNWLETKGGKNGGPLAPSTVSNRCRRARGIFTLAAKRGWIHGNPFSVVASGSETNPKRDRYISVKLFTKIVDATADVELRLLLALVRFCGLRCPSEIQPLTWAAVDWAGAVLVVQSPKTERHEGQERREVPLFNAVQPYLLAAAEARNDGEPLMFPRHQGTRTAITDRLAVLCRKVGEPLWPKPFVNLRASAENDVFDAGHNIHEVAAWFGHSPEIALKHYSRVFKQRSARTAAGALRLSEPAIKAKHEAKFQNSPNWVELESSGMKDDEIFPPASN